MPRKTVHYDTIIISDVHLGSQLSQATALLKLLKRIKFDRLILLGDMFADLNFSRLSTDQWQVLSYFRELSSPQNNIEVVWVAGNHDIELQKVMSHLVGIEVLDKYEWNTYTKRCIAMHGHQFDPAMLGMPSVSRFISWAFIQLQKIPGFPKAWSRWIDYITGHFQNLTRILENRAHKYALLHGYDVICCGHTHEELHSHKDGIDYYNSGCWVKNTGTYIAFSGDTIEILQDKHD